MNQLVHSPVVRTASLLLFVSLSSCASAANYVLTGKWEDPNREEPAVASEKETPKSSDSRSSSGSGEEKKRSKSAAVAASSEPALAPFPNETVFAYGPWQFYRNAHGLFWWTGKDATLQLFAIELDPKRPCWTTRKADGPRVLHCPMGDSIVAADLKATANSKDNTASAANDAFHGLPNPPWRSNVEATELPEGKFSLVAQEDSETGTFSIETTGATINVRVPPAPKDERLFVIKKDSTNVLFSGAVVDLFDGCSKSDGTLSVFMGIGFKLAKKDCGFQKVVEDGEATLTKGELEVRFKTLSQPPDIAKARAGMAKLKEIAAKNKAQLQISVEGDATYTLISTVATKATGEKIALVESDRIIGDQTFRCQAKFEGDATANLQAAKQICATMRAIK